ncbi:FHA domain-containing protein [Actinomycetospora corticicola]|uniref:ABC-type multidrug transport system ATPase subunit/pSer/pThr/pTyr-binding forkhead associated (FHA) protein n=1 Tax=Actinomycetospora corticicola TaxID=663602 RepID=A0A7Y9DSU9_9PSEU|nr:ATP-binding cassette domain-containing protein [Actinomycetospora corticicola]NYD34562.1 ABC-type multidrug transport system ATPase subunit/pSer/pThr/pTyr-binding forkhead associated (FHA) protein [Actinomycetospora corticicola]
MTQLEKSAERARPAPATPLEVRTHDRRAHVNPGTPFTIGRDESADLQVLGPEVSRHHVRITHGPQGWTIEDTSRNGTFAQQRRLTKEHVRGPLTVTLGANAGAPQVHLVLTPLPRPTPPRHRAPYISEAAQRSSRQGRFEAVHDLRTTPAALTIGRDERNDVVVQDLLASRFHAELRREGSRWVIHDLNSSNGTFVNGTRTRRQELGPADVVGIGHVLLHLEGDRLVEYVDTGAVEFRAEGIGVRTAKGKQLLRDVTFALESKSLLAVVGPSGAGKSTLLKALTGFRPADEGRVEYAGRDLYADYDELRQRIGLVPQDDILHPQLSVRKALHYAAELRFPDDVAAEERRAGIDEVIHELGLDGQAEQPIHTLSGGQRKRTSVALELLTRPSLLFLDEPTSGLDPGLDKSVMRTLRGLADDGRTVVVVTHSVANLDLCDRLMLLAPGGEVAFFGPPEEALAYFGKTGFADVFLLLQEHSDWGEKFSRSPAHARYVGRASAPPQPTQQTSAGTAARRQQSVRRQFTVLARRYLAVIAADRQYLIFMAALPLVLSVLAHALPGEAGLSMTEQLRGAAGAPHLLWLVLVVGAALMGSAASIRELVKEREIYRRERAIGLSRGAYLTSKLVVLGAIVGVQAVVLGVLGTVGRPSPDEPVLLGSGIAEIVVALVLLTAASMAVGLAVSALIDNADRGMPLLVLLAMLQFILSSALMQIGERPGLGQLAWLVPARWGFAAGAATIGIPTGPAARPFDQPDPLWDHTAGTWLADLGVLAVVTALFVALTWWLLRRLDPARR